MNAALLLEHYARVADAPDAIGRLRRFIRDLAVRGKLIEQNPNDEQAAELLWRIAKEKARLVEAGEIAKINDTAVASQDEVSFALPSLWQPAMICQVLNELQTGPFGSSLHQSDYRVGGTPVINPASIQDERIVPIDKMAVDGRTLERLTSFKLRLGDIVMARRGEMGRCAIVTSEEAGWLCGTGSLILRPSSSIFAQFLVLLIGSPYSRQYLGGSAVGATMQNLNQSILLNLSFGLPPLAEQHRIVAKVDELMALCDQLEAARAAREYSRDRFALSTLARLNTPDPETLTADARFALTNLAPLTTRADQIKQLRQTILNLAVRGKLVEQDPNDEPASEQLRRIGRAKSASQKAKQATRDAKRPDAANCAEPVISGWTWSTLGELALSMRYGTSVKCEREMKGAAVLRIPNVPNGAVDLADLKYGPLSEKEQADLALEVGDLLMIRSNGSLAIVGRSAVVTPEAAGMSFAGYLVRVRLLQDAINSRYVWLALNSTAIRDTIEIPIRSAVGLKNVNLTEFGALNIPLPPLAEQNRIVARVDELMALFDQLEASITTGEQTRSRLLEAVLHHALEPA